MLPIVHTLGTSNGTTNSEKRLSRKRRYLIFPDSSSLQLGNVNLSNRRLLLVGRKHLKFNFISFVSPRHTIVYDSTITIPDHTLYVTTGVTCALAWGLPTTPSYPDVDFAEKEDEVAVDENDRHDKNRTDTTVTNTIPSQAYNTSSIENMLWKYFNYLQHRRPDSYYLENASHCADGRCSYNKDTHTYNYTYGGSATGSNSMSNQYPIPYSSDYDRYHKYEAFTKYMVQNYFKPWMQYNANEKSSSQNNSGSQKTAPHISTEWTTT